jgi:hypothetical protein
MPRGLSGVTLERPGTSWEALGRLAVLSRADLLNPLHEGVCPLIESGADSITGEKRSG